MKKLLEKKINPLFAVLVVFLLGFFLLGDFDIRYIYAYAVLGVLLVVGVVLSGVWRPGKGLKQTAQAIWNKVTPLKACFLFLAFVTALFTVLPNSNICHLVISLTISMLVFTAYLLFMEPTERGIRRAFVAIHVISLLFVAYIMLVKLCPEFYWNNIYPYLSEMVQEQADKLLPMGYGVPVGGSSTYTDYLMAIALLVNVGEIFIEGAPKSRKRFAFIIVSSALYASAILLMGRRSEVLALGAAGVMILLLHAKPSDKEDALRRWGAILGILLVTVIILIPFVKGGDMDRYDAFFGEEITEQTANQLTSGRTELWEKAWELFKEKPIFGIGWEQFMNNNTFNHEVHNTYLQWLCESGVVGFVLLMTPTMFMYAMTFKRTIRYRKKDRAVSYAVKQMNFVSLGMQTFLLAVNLVDPAYYHLNYFCFYALVIGLDDTAARLEKETTAGSEKTCLIKAIWESAKLF